MVSTRCSLPGLAFQTGPGKVQPLGKSLPTRSTCGCLCGCARALACTCTCACLRPAGAALVWLCEVRAVWMRLPLARPLRDWQIKHISFSLGPAQTVEYLDPRTRIDKLFPLPHYQRLPLLLPTQSPSPRPFLIPFPQLFSAVLSLLRCGRWFALGLLLREAITFLSFLLCRPSRKLSSAQLSFRAERCSQPS